MITLANPAFDIRACPVWAIPQIARAIKTAELKPVAFYWSDGEGYLIGHQFLGSQLYVTLFKANMQKPERMPSWCPRWHS